MKVLEATRGWSRYGVRTVEAIARLTGRDYVAEAQPVCCNLALPDTNCPGTAPNVSCPSGYVKKEWTCCYTAGHRVWGCIECTTGSTCWNGSFACSDYYPTQYTC